jgi:GAF domain-containing protein
VVHASLDFDEIARLALMESAKVLGAESSTLSIREGDRHRLAYTYGLADEIADETESVPELGYVGTTALDDAEFDPRIPALARKQGVRSMIGTPLVTKSATLGILYLGFHSAKHRFTQLSATS